MQFQLDNDFKNILGELSEEEKQRLRESIIDEGLRDHVITAYIREEDATYLIDGYNRLEALEAIGQCQQLEGKIKRLEFDSRIQAIQWVVGNQLGRRNMKVHQRCALGVRLHDQFAKQGKSNQEQGLEESAQPWNTAEEVAREVGVSLSTYKHYRWLTIHKPRSLRSLESGNESINSLYKKHGPTRERRRAGVGLDNGEGEQHETTGNGTAGTPTQEPSENPGNSESIGGGGAEAPTPDTTTAPPANPTPEDAQSDSTAPFVILNDSAALWAHIQNAETPGRVIPVITHHEQRAVKFIVFARQIEMDAQILFVSEDAIEEHAQKIYDAAIAG